MTITKIPKTTLETKEKMKKKSMLVIPNNASERGLKPDAIKHLSTDPIFDTTNSVQSELDRIVEGINSNYDEIADKGYVDSCIDREIANSEAETEDKLANLEVANKDYVDSQIADLDLKIPNKDYVDRKITETEDKLNEKADKTFVNPAFKDVEVAKDTINGTYTFTFTKLDNTTKEVQIDTPEEFIIDYNNPPYLEGNNLIITFVGGSTISIDMSTLVKYNTFESTTTIKFEEDINHNVKATLKEGSVKISHLNTEVISKINDNTTNIAKNKQDIAKNKQDISDLKSGGGGGYEPDGETIKLNNNNELEVTNVAIWRYE